METSNQKLPDSEQPSGLSSSQPAPMVVSTPSFGQGAAGEREPSTPNDGSSRG